MSHDDWGPTVNPTNARSPILCLFECEVSQSAHADERAITTTNVENLDAQEAETKDRFAQIAEIIVDNLAALDLIVLEEVQDNTGPVDDEGVGADLTYGALIRAIQDAGGPVY